MRRRPTCLGWSIVPLPGRRSIIARAGKPLARLVAYEPAVKERELGAWRGKVTIGADFDDVDEELAKAFEADE